MSHITIDPGAARFILAFAQIQTLKERADYQRFFWYDGERAVLVAMAYGAMIGAVALDVQACPEERSFAIPYEHLEKSGGLYYHDERQVFDGLPAAANHDAWPKYFTESTANREFRGFEGRLLPALLGAFEDMRRGDKRANSTVEVAFGEAGSTILTSGYRLAVAALMPCIADPRASDVRFEMTRQRRVPLQGGTVVEFNSKGVA